MDSRKIDTSEQFKHLGDSHVTLKPSITMMDDPDRKTVELKDSSFTNDEIKQALNIKVKEEERPTVSVDAVVAGDPTIDLDG